jgi:hypothetical protein
MNDGERGRETTINFNFYLFLFLFLFFFPFVHPPPNEQFKGKP